MFSAILNQKCWFQKCQFQNMRAQCAQNVITNAKTRIFPHENELLLCSCVLLQSVPYLTAEAKHQHSAFSARQVLPAIHDEFSFFFRRGHRRNASEYLPDSAHYRAGHSYQDRENRFQDAASRNYDLQQGSSAPPPQPAGGPPRYTSNPNLTAPEVNPEYERPPPYYYPGAPPSAATGSDVAPPLPMPNRS